MNKVIALTLIASLLLVGCINSSYTQLQPATGEQAPSTIEPGSPQDTSGTGETPSTDAGGAGTIEPPATGETSGNETTQQPETPAASDVKELSVTAKQWSFEPASITVKKGTKVNLKITSIDVAHGFSLPDFNVNTRLEPGQETVVEFTPDKVGSFNFFCSVFCGSGHGGMTGTLVVEE